MIVNLLNLYKFMKNLLLILLVCPVLGWGQTVDGVNLAEKQDVRYLKVLVADAGKFGKTRYRISVDYGQQPGGNQNFTILDDSGKPREWVSDMEVVNYFSGLGWDLMYQYRTTAGGSNVGLDAFVMRRRQ